MQIGMLLRKSIFMEKLSTIFGLPMMRTRWEFVWFIRKVH